jgi:hypothetical protein
VRNTNCEALCYAVPPPSPSHSSVDSGISSPALCSHMPTINIPSSASMSKFYAVLGGNDIVKTKKSDA